MSSYKSLNKQNETPHTRDDRESISTDELIAAYPNGFTIPSFRFGYGKTANKIIVNIAEIPDRFYWASKSLTDLIWAIMEECGSLEQANERLETETLTVKLEKVKTKTGHIYTRCTVVDTPDETPIPF